MFSKEVQDQLLGIAKQVSAMVEESDRAAKALTESVAFKEFLENLKNLLPKDVQETEIYDKTMSFQKSEISYSDICWLRKFIDRDNHYRIKDDFSQSKLDKYIIEIIDNQHLRKREKIVVLLSNFDSLVYQRIGHVRRPWDKVKNIAKDNADELHTLTIKSLEAITIEAICFVVYSNTDSYNGVIDKRIPFRNNILHNGTIEYSDQEIDEAYDFLIDYIYVLIGVYKSAI